MSTFDYSSFSSSEAAELQEIAQRLRDLVPRACLLIIEIGDALKAAKVRLRHGGFCSFCIHEAGIEIRTAENYLSLAELAKIYPPTEIAQLGARSAYQLAAKTAPTEIVEQVMTEVRGGRVPRFDEVKRRISQAKGRATTSNPDVDDLVGRMLDALDAQDVGNIERLLRTATKAVIVAFCEQLRLGLEERHARPAAVDVLPKNML